MFLIYINDFPLACKSCSFVFAHDTNKHGLSCANHEFINDLDKVSWWLKANKLSRNFKETVQVNITSNSTSNVRIFFVTGKFGKKSCNYLGILLVSTFIFRKHIETVHAVASTTRNLLNLGIMFLEGCYCSTLIQM